MNLSIGFCGLYLIQVMPLKYALQVANMNPQKCEEYKPYCSVIELLDYHLNNSEDKQYWYIAIWPVVVRGNEEIAYA